MILKLVNDTKEQKIVTYKSAGESSQALLIISRNRIAIFETSEKRLIFSAS